jgi:hypothetical protein
VDKIIVDVVQSKRLSFDSIDQRAETNILRVPPGDETDWPATALGAGYGWTYLILDFPVGLEPWGLRCLTK